MRSIAFGPLSVSACELHRQADGKAMMHMKRQITLIEQWPRIGTSTGLHLLGEWFGCDGRQALLSDAPHLQRLCLLASRMAGLSIMGYLFHQCVPTGVTGTILLSESHLAIHTWPDERSAILDVFVGSNALNNRTKAQAVYGYVRDELLPNKENFLQVDGGGFTDSALLSH
jgi:S-adenosylmethionine decarboxylase